MAHRTVRSYDALVERLNRFPQGAPRSELLSKILSELMSEREAELVAELPIRPFGIDTAAKLWRVRPSEAEAVLDELAGRALLLDLEGPDGQRRFVLPPPMAGFFEFSLMRLRDDLDQKALSELLYEYITVEDDFILDLFTTGETQLGRVFVSEPALPADRSLHVLDWERATHVVETASHIGVGLCYCRHKMQHLGKACDAPLDICMTFSSPARSLIAHGHARPIDAAECLDLLAQARELGLVQFGENARQRVSFICNCCGCCCEAMIAARRFAHLHPVHTTNWIAELPDDGSCTGCGTCVNACPVEALALVSANDPHRPRRKVAQLDADRCLGCGVCVQACPEERVHLAARAERVITPLDAAHRTVLMAIERGTLQHLIFDKHALLSHRVMATILGVILRLGPVRRALANRQLHSRYLEALFERAAESGVVPE
jgi:ferredoxin